MPSKWFDRKTKNNHICLPDPVPIASLDEVTSADIEQLLLELQARRIDLSIYEFFKLLAKTPPASRLARNLRELIKCFADHEIQSVMSDGLAAGEREALIALELGGFALKEKRTAQLLLNIEERYQLFRALSATFRRARFRRDGWLTSDTNGRQNA